MYSDLELIALLKQKDQPACDYLFEKYAGALQALIAQIMPDNEYTNELLEKTFATICQDIHEYDPTKTRLFTWMLQTARQIAIAKLKAAYPRRYPDSLDTVKGNVGFGKLIKKLNTEDQALIGLAYLKGLSTEDVARQLNLPTETVRTKIRLALSQLNSLL